MGKYITFHYHSINITHTHTKVKSPCTRHNGIWGSEGIAPFDITLGTG